MFLCICMTSRTKFDEDVPFRSLATTALLLLVVVLQVGDVAETAHRAGTVDHVAVRSVRGLSRVLGNFELEVNCKC